MKTKVIIGGAIVILLTICLTGVWAAWDQSTHGATTDNSDWCQYRLDCYVDQSQITTTCTIDDYYTPDPYEYFDSHATGLDPDDWINVYVPTSTIDHGAYNLILSLDVWWGNDYTVDPSDYQITIKVDDVYYYYSNNIPSNSPFILSGGEYPNFNNYNFGEVWLYNEKTENHLIYIKNEADIVKMVIDEIILTPA